MLKNRCYTQPKKTDPYLDSRLACLLDRQASRTSRFRGSDIMVDIESFVPVGYWSVIPAEAGIYLRDTLLFSLVPHP